MHFDPKSDQRWIIIKEIDTKELPHENHIELVCWHKDNL